jgi:uncharacterized protein DUF6226
VNAAEQVLEGYPRATRAGRFAVLHDTAERLIDKLDETYTVERRETKESLNADGPLVRTVWVVPHCPAAAPLAVMFTDFPSIVLRLGRFYRRSMPACGCDACDEDAGALAADLRVQVTALVEGGLWERVRRGLIGSWSETLLVGPDFRVTQQMPLETAVARAARRDGFAAAVQWAPWPRRAADVRPRR